MGHYSANETFNRTFDPTAFKLSAEEAVPEPYMVFM
jgi:hypothetical protein